MTSWFDVEPWFQRRILAGEPAAMKLFVERIAREHRITWEYVTHDFRANVLRRHVYIPPPVAPRELAVDLHEEAHVINGPCPQTGRHLRHPRQGCLECERDAWRTAMRLVPFVDREMHHRLATALKSYRRGLSAPRVVERDADRLIGNLSWLEHRQSVFNLQERLARQRRVMESVQRAADRRRAFEQRWRLVDSWKGYR